MSASGGFTRISLKIGKARIQRSGDREKLNSFQNRMLLEIYLKYLSKLSINIIEGTKEAEYTATGGWGRAPEECWEVLEWFT